MPHMNRKFAAAALALGVLAGGVVAAPATAAPAAVSDKVTNKWRAKDFTSTWPTNMNQCNDFQYNPPAGVVVDRWRGCQLVAPGVYRAWWKYA